MANSEFSAKIQNTARLDNATNDEAAAAAAAARRLTWRRSMRYLSLTAWSWQSDVLLLISSLPCLPVRLSLHFYLFIDTAFRLVSWKCHSVLPQPSSGHSSVDEFECWRCCQGRDIVHFRLAIHLQNLERSGNLTLVRKIVVCLWYVKTGGNVGGENG